METTAKPTTVLTIKTKAQLLIEAKTSSGGAQRVGNTRIPFTVSKSFVVEGPGKSLTLEADSSSIEIIFRSKGAEASVSLGGEVTIEIDGQFGEVLVSDYRRCLAWSGCNVKKPA
jgi:hypothetical protein